MKKSIAMLSAACILTGILCGSGCSNDASVKEKFPDEIKGEYLLYDYENYTQNFELLLMTTTFGRLSVNHEKDYVKSGEQSLKINPMGSSISNDKPHFVVPTVSERFNFNYSNFNEIYSVKCSVYNASNESVNMEIGLAQSPDKQTLSAFFDTYSLKQGWNEIEYVIWDGANLNGISGVYFRFENYALQGREIPELYMDDFILNQKDGLVRNLPYYPVEEGELLTIRDFSSLSYVALGGYSNSPEWVSQGDLEQMTGDYTGKAMKFNATLGQYVVQVKPRINKDELIDLYAEGYTKISFWISAEASNGKTVKMIADTNALDPSIYTGGAVDLTAREWKKVTVELTENNIDRIFNEEGGYVRLCAFRLSTTDRLNDDGSTAILTSYIGDIKIEK